jgi:hypothetical protein
MKGRLYLAAVSILALILAGLGGALSYAADQPSASKSHSSTDLLGFQHEPTAQRLPATLPFTRYVRQQTDVGPGDTGAAIATCPGASVVVGGGCASKPDVTFFTQYKYGNGWRGDAKNNASVTRQITVYAVCLHNVSGASVTQTHGQVYVPAGDKGQAVAACPAGTVATGGGFYAYPDKSLRVYNSSKADSGQRWQSWAQNMSGSSKTHHAYAICLSGTGGSSTRILQSATIPPNTIGSAIAT